MASGRKATRAEIRQAFAPELAGAAPEESVRLACALEVALSSVTWESLRLHQGLSVEEAKDQVRAMVLAFLAAWGPQARDRRPTGR